MNASARMGILIYGGLFLFVCTVVSCLFGWLPLGMVNLNTMTPEQMLLGAIIFGVSAAIGLAIKLILDYSKTSAEITWIEYIVGVVVIGLVFSIVGVNIAWNQAFKNTVTYNEYWNGWELAAVEEVTPCTRDGSCVHEYDCDPYPVKHESCSGTGKDRKCTEWTTIEYHDCPYATQEVTYKVQTTLGDYTIDNHVFSPDPAVWEPHRGAILPGVQRGPSQFWTDAKNRCVSANPGPVTKRSEYPNYILASDTTILKQYSSQIEVYTRTNVLPAFQFGVRDFYYSDKVYFVGYSPVDKSAWQMAHAKLNAAFGDELQGDLHVVIVQNNSVSANPDAYLLALKAYWQSYFGKDALSKNTVIVVLGTTDGQTVAWARAITGMPLGNETMTLAIRNKMKGVALTPDSVFGNVTGQAYEKVKDDGTKKIKVRGIGDNGALRRILWGLDTPADKFVRISMSGDSAGDVGGGFKYLASEIKPTPEQQSSIVFISVLLSIGVWLVEAFLIGERARQWGRSRSSW